MQTKQLHGQNEWLVIGQIVQSGAALGIMFLAIPKVAESQVGLTSGMAQVGLVARIAPRGSVQRRVAKPAKRTAALSGRSFYS